MQFNEIVGQPWRYIMHQGGEFLGEGWLLQFKAWKVHAKDGMTQCTVDLGSGQVYIWFITTDLHYPESFERPDMHTFLVCAEEAMTDSGSKKLLKVVALQQEVDSFALCRNQP